MAKIISKSFNIFLVISIIFVSFFNLPNVYAKTVNDLQAELNKLEAEAKETENKIEYTEAQIAQAKTDISQISSDMASISKEIVAKTEEIADLGDEIEKKDKETKELMEFIQISNGYSFYLDYVMGAETLTDFIYRISVTEQLSDYNSKLIVEMNDIIKANEARKIELNNKTVELDKKQAELSGSLTVLSSQKTQLYENSRSIEDEIAVSREVIQMYRDAGCGNNEDINVCASRLLPADTRFWRPLVDGRLSSGFGYRTYTNTNGKVVNDYHEGYDMVSNNRVSTKIYAVANGKVANVFWDKYGGNQIVIHHKIISNGTIKYYSSTYAHLASIYVRTGDLVTKDTALGIMGNTGGNGVALPVHLHLAISTGLRYKDYVSYNDYVAHSFPPSNVINFPGMGVYWYDRITRY